MKKYLILLVIASLGACTSIHKGSYISNAELSKGNFKYINFAEGESKATYFLGIGGFDSQGLTKEAKREMYKNANLQPNQIIANVTVDSKTSYYLLFLWREHQVFVSGDVVEFTDNDINSINPNSEFFKNLNSNNSKINVAQTNPNDYAKIKNDNDSSFRQGKTNYTGNNITHANSIDNAKIKNDKEVSFRQGGKTYTGKVIKRTNEYVIVEYYKKGKLKVKKIYF